MVFDTGRLGRCKECRRGKDYHRSITKRSGYNVSCCRSIEKDRIVVLCFARRRHRKPEEVRKDLPWLVVCNGVIKRRE